MQWKKIVHTPPLLIRQWQYNDDNDDNDYDDDDDNDDNDDDDDDNDDADNDDDDVDDDEAKNKKKILDAQEHVINTRHNVFYVTHKSVLILPQWKPIPI